MHINIHDRHNDYKLASVDISKMDIDSCLFTNDYSLSDNYHNYRPKSTDISLLVRSPARPPIIKALVNVPKINKRIPVMNYNFRNATTLQRARANGSVEENPSTEKQSLQSTRRNV